MNTRFYFILIALMVSINCIQAQKQINLVDINIVNLGDGQMYVHERDNKDKPVTGKVRMINGVTTEYYDAELEKGYPTGKWEYFRNNKLKEELNFKNGYLNGKQAYFFPSGEPEYEASFKEGKKDGDWIYYNDRGGRRELIVYKDNSMVKKLTYYTNGNIDMERNFKNGKEDGFKRTYTQDGTLKSEKNYSNGIQIGQERSLISSNNGQFMKTCNYNDKGNLDGAYYEEWVEDKKPKAKGTYVNGEKEGKWTEWYAGGELRSEGVYKNGTKQ